MSNRSAQSAPLILLCAACLALPARAQNPAPQQNVTVLVVNVVAQPPQPVKAVRVSLQYLNTGAPITAAQQVTNSQGHAPLVVSSDVAQRGRLRVQIDGATGLVIYLPADGQLPDYQPSVVPATVEIELLPKGSQKLLDEGQIEANLHRMLVQLSAVRSQNAAMKAQLAEAQNAKPDLGPAIADWAAANGFSVDKVNQQVQAWANSIEDKSQATIEQKALAAIALKRYDEADQLLKQLQAADHKEIDAEDAEQQNLDAQVNALLAARQALLDKQRSSLRQLLDHSKQDAGADQLGLKFHDATQVLESAAATADAESKKHPDDRGFHELWLQAGSNAADARWREGDVAPADQSLPLLAQSANDFEMLEREYAALGDRQAAAAAQKGLGIALMREGERAGGDKAAALLDQAVQAYRRALEVQTKADLPQDWARTQMDLGIALMDEGERASGDKAAALLDQAVQAYRSALEVYTKADLPQDWARTQNNLGAALRNEAERAGGDTAAALFDQAVQAYRNALEVFTKADLPQYWADTQNNLGAALSNEAERARGEKAAALFDQAVQALRSALEVYTKADLPQDWAMTQNNLGIVLTDEGERAGGDNAAALFDQALQAYEHALEVYTKADSPRYWAMAMRNLATANRHLGDTASADAELKAANEVDPQ
ncbi:MAG: hypothetical protein ABSA42_20115 [Terracidiphilus sp.]|jgi:tetratricopeptide (TPR) repeat protein